MKEYPFWWDTIDRSRDAAGRPAASIPTTSVDVAIVGAGYTGLAAARQLARAGASVVVIDAEFVGWGASSRNAGQVLTGLRLEPAALIKRYGETRAKELFTASLSAIDALEALIDEEGIACEYERSGHLQAAWKPTHFNAFREEQALLERVFNHRTTLVSREDQRSEIGTDRYYGLLVDDRSAAINPAKYAAGLASAVTRSGVSVCEHVRVTRIVRQSRGWSVETAAGALTADDVLVATNGYADDSVPWLQRRFVPIGSYVIATEPLGPSARDLLPRGRTGFDSKHFLYYFRLNADRLVFGGRAAFNRPDAESTRRAAGILRRGMVTIFPQLADRRIDYAWSGNVAFTRDQMPRAGRVDGLWFAGGYCGHGIAMATYLGLLVARRIGGELIEHPLFDDQFQPIPLYSGRPWFLPLVGAYYTLRDIVE